MNIKEIILEALIEEKAKPSAGVSKAKKSKIEKEAKAGKNVFGGHFGSVENKIEKEGYSKKAAQKIAAASMWEKAAK